MAQAVASEEKRRTVEHDIPSLVSLFRRGKRTSHVVHFLSRSGVVLRGKVERSQSRGSVTLQLTKISPEIEELDARVTQVGSEGHEAIVWQNFAQSVQNLPL
jgi:hypothetical protein